MFQTFDPPGDISIGAERTGRLRDMIGRLGLDAFLIPRADEFQGEYVPPSAERLKWLTGFSGSAGLAVVGKKKAALLVDGRYTAQSRLQVATDIFEIVQVPEAKLSDWLAANLPNGAVIGFDPWLHTISNLDQLRSELKSKAMRLKPVSRNPIDRIWGKERPTPPTGLVTPQPIEFAGKAAIEKIAELQKRLKREGRTAVLLTKPDGVAWLFNIRGSDVAHTPVPLGFAIVPADGKSSIFLAAEKIGPQARSHLAPLARIEPPSALTTALAMLKAKSAKVQIDPAWTAQWFLSKLGAKSIVRDTDPVTSAKAPKNDVELAGTRAAHVRDGAAMVKFLAWLDREAASGELDEISAVEKLEACRRETGELAEISFDTISGSGPHGAIVHYRVTTATNRKLKPGELFLLDSGGQYRDGTTDVTRTIAIGKPTAEMRRAFTLVLKGHIALAMARFPKGTRGIQLDTLARMALWSHGLDYDHGTGHGVGSFLSVHEGPQSISKGGMAALEPGMIVSNEPGYYKEGAFGIRIENLVVVTPLEKITGGDRDMMGFETITLCPIDRRLIDPKLLSVAEIEWIDAYHARVRKGIGRNIRGEDRVWLHAATEPVGE